MLHENNSIETNMKHIKLKFSLSVIIALLLGIVSGYCIGYFPMKREVKDYEYSFEYYRDKYLNECEIYDDIMRVACHQEMNDYSKLYYIRSTYSQPGRWEEIQQAIKLKKSIERNKE